MASCDDPNLEDNAQLMDLDLPAGMFLSGDKVEETTVQMQHRLPNFANPSLFNIDVKYTAVDDVAIFEGDIVLGDLETIRNAVDSKGIGIPGTEFRWPGGIIPFETKDFVKERVEAAVAHWEEHTAIRFKAHENEEDFISFEPGLGCSSKVGRHGGKQVISLGSTCSVGSAIHEIGHALGLWHEQSRSDRNQFIDTVPENIKPKARHNFDMHIQDGMDLGEYDFNSIMHYPANAFGIGGKATILTKNGEAIGQRNGLSKGDILSIKMLYPDLDWPEEEKEVET